MFISYKELLIYYLLFKKNFLKDILFTFEWPLDVLDRQSLINLKGKIPYTFAFQNGDLFNDLGSLMYKNVLDKVKPIRWFAGKIPFSLSKVYKHSETKGEETKFYSINKYQPNQNRIEIIEIEDDKLSKKGFEYDLEWLAILKATNQFVSIQKELTASQLPEHEIKNLDEEKRMVKKALKNRFKIASNFKCSLSIKSNGDDTNRARTRNYISKQTKSFCDKLQLTDPNQLIAELTAGDLNETDKEKDNSYYERVFIRFNQLFNNWICVRVSE